MSGTEEQRLQALRSRMTEVQRKDMAEIIQADLDRREREKAQMASKAAAASGVKKASISGSLKPEQIKELYGDVNEAVKQIRLRKIEEQLNDVRQMRPRPAGARVKGALNAAGSSFSPTRALLAFAVVGIAVLKILFSSGIVDASVNRDNRTAPALSKPALIQQPVMIHEETKPAERAPEQQRLATAATVLSESDVKVLTQLDARRVDLEKRKEALDRREAEVESQARALAERLAELRSLTDRLSQARIEKDQKYEARLEQLSTVYGSMAPNEAAPLIAKLDTPIALSLLQRMPGKKMGQILSVMEPERAVELTKLLSDGN